MIYLSFPETNREKQKSNRKADLVVLCFSRSLLCACMLLYVLFDCRCKSSNRLGENMFYT